jgi:hypothetical protein
MGKAKKRITKGKRGTKDIGTAINKDPIIAQNHLFSFNKFLYISSPMRPFFKRKEEYSLKNKYTNGYIKIRTYKIINPAIKS